MAESALQPSIRRSDSTDMPAVLVLLQSAGLPTADLSSAQQLRLWVLQSDSLQGVIALQRFGADALLRSLAVAPESRQRGLGHQLVARLENEAKSDGIERLILLTETAQDFFRTLDYQVIDRQSVGEALQQSAEFRSLCPASAVCMSKTLQS